MVSDLHQYSSFSFPYGNRYNSTEYIYTDIIISMLGAGRRMGSGFKYTGIVKAIFV